jgi:hypothetical protein
MHLALKKIRVKARISSDLGFEISAFLLYAQFAYPSYQIFLILQISSDKHFFSPLCFM